MSPVIEAMPGDTVAAHLEDSLKPRATNDPQTMAHGPAGENPTNLHYFHGGIVTPNNARPPIDAGKGNGDNIYVRLKNGMSFDYNVPIPGEKELDARVLEGKGFISHPNGLNWYHSHMHGISSDQVMGGLAGLLSVGEDKANVRAKCNNDPPNPEKCNKDTADLKERTIVRYALLQDISLDDISALPEDAAQPKTAQWAPRDRDSFDPVCPAGPDPKLRKGFCQRAQKSAWLFTLNGQRFPTITVEDNQNLLLRIGNLSANVAYWLELYNESTGKTLPLTVLSLDGVVPARPVDPQRAKIPVDAFAVNDLLVMPASRAEIYVRNDDQDPPHSDEQVYILRTKGLDAGSDQWPEIQLARVVLKPTIAVSSIALALNAPIGQIRVKLAGPSGKEEVPRPEGCVRDLGEGEHRRVTFVEGGETSGGVKTDWSIATEIMHPPSSVGDFDEGAFKPDEKATIGTYDNDGNLTGGVPFEEYVQTDASIDWLKKHICIRLDHKGSHQQLWVLQNPTSGLHNFHIHQMKFRLATRKELVEKYHIKPPKESHTCPDPDKDKEPCSQPDYKFYDNDPKSDTAESEPVWHDTIPVPNGPGYSS